MKIFNWFKNPLVLAVFIGISLIGIAKTATVTNGTNLNNLVLDENKIYDSDATLRLGVGSPNTVNGAIGFGNSTTVTAITLPTTTTGPNFGIRVPVYNAGAAIVAGNVLIATSAVVAGTLTGVAQVCLAPTTTAALTTIVGVAADAIANGAIGWMSPRGGGYAVVQATGAITWSDVLVSTGTGLAIKGNTPTTGTDFAVAMSTKSATAAGNVLVIMR